MPIALLYAELGHLVVLTPPNKGVDGSDILSPDGFLDVESNTIEFKRTTKGKESTLENQIVSASKNGLATIRSLWIHDSTSPELIARKLNGKYNASKRMDRVDVFYRGRLIQLSREMVGHLNYAGLLDLFQ